MKLQPFPSLRTLALGLLPLCLWAATASAQEISLRPEEWRAVGAQCLPDGTIQGTHDKLNYGGILKSVTMDLDKAPVLVLEIEKPSAGWYVILSNPQLEKGQKHIQLDTSKEGTIELDVAKITGLTGTQECTLNLGVVRMGSPDPVKGVSLVCKGLRMVPRSDTRPPLARKSFPALASAPPLFACEQYAVFPDRVDGKKGSAGLSIDGNLLLSNCGGILKKTVPSIPEGLPSVKTGAPLFDALYALALEEAAKNIRKDGSFMAGAQWKDVWTRDATYSLHLSLNLLLPKNALLTYQATVDDGEIVQDPKKASTAWPSQTDRIIWLIAAYDYYCLTGDTEFAKFALETGRKSIARAIREIYDPATGLFKGESSFLDWAKQTYPGYMTRKEMARTKSLSINVLYAKSLDVLSQLEHQFGTAPAAEKATALAEKTKRSVNDQLWLGDDIGYYGYFLYLQGQISTRSEGLGEALAVLFHIADGPRADSVIARTPATDYGVPCIFPQHLQQIPYHNLAAWPFVQSYFGWAAATRKNQEAVLFAIATQMRHAAVYQTFKENINIQTGGTEQKINSDRQLWSVAGFLSTPFRILLGMEVSADSFTLNPFVPHGFGPEITISGLNYRNAILDIRLLGEGDAIQRITLDDKPAEKTFKASDLSGKHSITIWLEKKEMRDGLDIKTSNLFSPEPVLAINATATDQATDLTWSASEGATSYLVFADNKLIGQTEKCEFKVADSLLPKTASVWVNIVAVGEGGNRSDAGKFIAVTNSSAPKPLILAHYMSWFQTPPISGSWGFWQVNRERIDKKYWQNPEKRNALGWREVSSVFYPVIGPYDSADPALCEYHILLAKLAGIDAFVADWYGPDPSKEHPYDNIGFLAMKKKAEEMGFKVLICWEDRSVFPPISPGVKTRQEAVARGKEMMRYLEKEWFSSPAYLRLDGAPLLTNFCWGDAGENITKPFLSAAEWTEILDSASERVAFIHDFQWHRKANDFTAYDSVMPWGSVYGGRETYPEFCAASRNSLGKGKFSFLSGTVLPGFDNRGCGGWTNDINVIDRRNGNKFRANWEEMLQEKPRVIQIPTWNDFNEGGTIEPVRNGVLLETYPSEGYGYRELETTQEYAAKLGKIQPDKAALAVPQWIYFCRKLAALDKTSEKAVTPEIDKAVALLLSGKTAEAKALAEKIYSTFPEALKTGDLQVVTP
jgi:hypothetical protein